MFAMFFANLAVAMPINRIIRSSLRDAATVDAAGIPAAVALDLGTRMVKGWLTGMAHLDGSFMAK